MTVSAIDPAGGTATANTDREAMLRSTARAYEASFIAEMLKHSGINRTSDAFGGGPGEDAFASFLTEAYANEIAEAGGIGLAESIYLALLEAGDRS